LGRQGHTTKHREPGDTVYRINLISADEPDASITVEHIDHPQF